MKCAFVHILTLKALKGGSSTIKPLIRVSKASVVRSLNQILLILWFQLKAFFSSKSWLVLKDFFFSLWLFVFDSSSPKLPFPATHTGTKQDITEMEMGHLAKIYIENRDS